MDNKIPGSVIGVQIGTKWLNCQSDATLNIVANTSEDALCKPEGTAPVNGSAPWKTFTVDSREWNITVNAALLKDSLAAANNDTNLAKLLIDGNYNIDNVMFKTVTDQTDSNYDMIYSGAAILTNFTLNAPVSGANTTAATFQGNDELTYSYVPVTT